MKHYRLYRRNGRNFYLHDNLNGKQRSLGTADPEEAQRLLYAENEAMRQTHLLTSL